MRMRKAMNADQGGEQCPANHRRSAGQRSLTRNHNVLAGKNQHVNRKDNTLHTDESEHQTNWKTDRERHSITPIRLAVILLKLSKTVSAMTTKINIIPFESETSMR